MCLFLIKKDKYIEVSMAQHFNTTGLISQISPEDGKIYDVHDKAALHSSSEIAFSETDDTNFKHDMMTHVAENLHEYAMLTLEDGKYLDTDSEYGKILVTPLGVFLISEETLSFDRTDEVKWKQPMMNYINANQTYDAQSDTYKTQQLKYISDNIDFDSLSDDFKNKLMQYVVENWAATAGGEFIITDK